MKSTLVNGADWETFRSGKGQAGFQGVYEGTKDLVYTICRRILVSEENALDAFQSVDARARRSSYWRGGAARQCNSLSLPRSPTESLTPLEEPPHMKAIVAGATGTLGSVLCEMLRGAGHQDTFLAPPHFQ
ncbi:hypothetical protein BH09SUM1_BH09SUM1_22240 [soil metagenome]